MTPRFPIAGVNYRTAQEKRRHLESGAWLPITAGESLREAASEVPDKLAVIAEDGTYTLPRTRYPVGIARRRPDRNRIAAGRPRRVPDRSGEGDLRRAIRLLQGRHRAALHAAAISRDRDHVARRALWRNRLFRADRCLGKLRPARICALDDACDADDPSSFRDARRGGGRAFDRYAGAEIRCQDRARDRAAARSFPRRRNHVPAFRRLDRIAEGHPAFPFRISWLGTLARQSLRTRQRRYRDVGTAAHP